jgi:hypothetical protein
MLLKYIIANIIKIYIFKVFHVIMQVVNIFIPLLILACILDKCILFC